MIINSKIAWGKSKGPISPKNWYRALQHSLFNHAYFLEFTFMLVYQLSFFQFDQLLMRNDYYSNSGADDNYTKLTNYTVITDDLKDEPIGT